MAAAADQTYQNKRVSTKKVITETVCGKVFSLENRKLFSGSLETIWPPKFKINKIPPNKLKTRSSTGGPGGIY